jgi:hypothetical protein
MSLPQPAVACPRMMLGETLIEVWRRVLVEGKSRFELASKSYPVTAARAKKLRTVRFGYAPYDVDANEQTPDIVNERDGVTVSRTTSGH